METGLLNFHDEERFNSVCKNSDFEKDNSFFGETISDYELDSFSIRNVPWDQSFNIKEIKIESGMNEDYERTFREWNQHLKEFDSELKCDGSLLPDLIDVDQVCINPVDFIDNLSKVVVKEEPCVKEEFIRVKEEFISVKEEFITEDPLSLPPPEVPAVAIKKEPIETEYKIPEIICNTSPAVEAGDLTSLLERFEAASKPQKPSPKKSSRSNFKPSPTIVNKSIKDALPKEVIDRIRESCKKRKNAYNESLAKAECVERPKEISSGVIINNRCCGQTVELDHNYCCRGECSGSRKDSGLESGEISDSSAPSPGLLAPVKREDSDSCLAVPQEEGVSSANEVGEKKKKKLKLEEYRERRKNMKPISPPRPKAPLKIVASQQKENPENEQEEKPSMISVEVQTEVREAKKEEKIDDELQKKREMWLENLKRTYRPRYSSTSSASSCGSRTRSKRRPRNKRYSGRSKGSSWSRSRSRSSFSSSSNSSSLASRSHSRSRSRSSNKKKRHSFCRNKNRKYSGRDLIRRRDRSPVDKMKQMEERRVVYVGQIEEGISKQKLRERFQKFGQIVAISLHFRERGDNYGFVTFKYPGDAYEAVEHGNEYGLEPHYDICFGGRRAFCKQRYSDLDNVTQQSNNFTPYPTIQQPPLVARTTNSFDLLLREAQENLRKRSTV